MNTPAILNSTAVATPGKHQSAHAEGAAPDMPFGHVLSREVARQDSAGADTASSNSGAGAAVNAQPSPTSATKAPDKNGNKDKSKEYDEKSAKDAAPDDKSIKNIPADMLALVASAEQMTRTDRPVATPPADAEAAPDAKAGIETLKADAAPHADRKTRVTDQLGAANDAETATANAKADFAVELKRSGDLQKPADAVDALQQPPKSAPVATEAPAIDAVAKTAADAVQAATGPQTLATLAAAQQVVRNAMHAAPANAADRLAPQVGTPGWDHALGQRVVWMVAGVEQSASLSLNPPDLGPLQIVLNVSNSTANATFVATQPEVRQALEAAMPKLRDMLGDAGIQLGQATVSSGSQQNQNGGQADTAPRTASLPGTRAGTADTQVRVPGARIVSSGNGLVDTFV